MTSELLKWIANGLIAVVLVSTVWMAQAMHTAHDGSTALVAQVVPAPAEAASAALTTTR